MAVNDTDRTPGAPTGDPNSLGDRTEEVVEAARQRAAALAAGDRERLGALLHPHFRWISHAGESFDHDSYLESNTRPDATRWTAQEMNDVQVVLHDRTAVLRCLVVDRFDRGHGPEAYEMPMTQVWVKHDGRWVCLAGHAGPRTA